jgi:hypothetical protein
LFPALQRERITSGISPEELIHASERTAGDPLPGTVSAVPRACERWSFDILHPNLGLVGESVFVVGVPAADDPDPRFGERTVWLWLSQLEGIEPLPTAAECLKNEPPAMRPEDCVSAKDSGPAFVLPSPVPSGKITAGHPRSLPMRAEELRAILYRKPFEPFRVRVKDGRSFDIRHPRLGLVGETVFIIGVPAPNETDPRLADHSVWVWLRDLDGIEPLSPSPSQAM